MKRLKQQITNALRLGKYSEAISLIKKISDIEKDNNNKNYFIDECLKKENNKIDTSNYTHLDTNITSIREILVMARIKSPYEVFFISNMAHDKDLCLLSLKNLLKICKIETQEQKYIKKDIFIKKYNIINSYTKSII